MREVCVYSIQQSSMLKKEKLKEKNEENSKLAVIIIVYVYVCVMQSTSIDKDMPYCLDYR